MSNIGVRQCSIFVHFSYYYHYVNIVHSTFKIKEITFNSQGKCIVHKNRLWGQDKKL